MLRNKGKHILSALGVPDIYYVGAPLIISNMVVVVKGAGVAAIVLFPAFILIGGILHTAACNNKGKEIAKTLDNIG